MRYLNTAENDSQPQSTNDKNETFVRQLYLKTLFQNESINNHVYSEDICKSATVIYHLTQERTCLSLSLISSRPLDHDTAKIKYADVKVILTKHYHKKVPLLAVTAKGV